MGAWVIVDTVAVICVVTKYCLNKMSMLMIFHMVKHCPDSLILTNEIKRSHSTLTCMKLR